MLPILQWKSNKYSERVFVILSIQHAMRVRHNVTVACLIVEHSVLPHDLINSAIKKKVNMRRVFQFSVQLLTETLFIVGRPERDVMKNVYIGLHVKYRLFLSDFNDT